jgi:queuine tRNA-ribosyltransferase
MPVGTQASVKAMSSEDLLALGAEIVLVNMYHVHLRPGEALIERAGGLHDFMNWHRPILTDSGGYQVFSLEALRDVDDDGVTFVSHIDGATHRLTPEQAVAIQEQLGSDIAVTLDEPVPYPGDSHTARRAAERSTAWARRGREAKRRGDQLLFGIVQGGFDPELRARCAEAVVAEGFDGHCIGGLSVGEPAEITFEMLAATIGALPPDRPRYLMGVGMPDDMLQAIALGVDMFDCVLPTRLGRNGCAFTRLGRLSLKAAAYAEDLRPIDEACSCPGCRGYTRAYVRHLYRGREILAARLVTYHNLHFYLDLMRRARDAILQGTYAGFRAEFNADCGAAPTSGP